MYLGPNIVLYVKNVKGNDYVFPFSIQFFPLYSKSDLRE